MQWIETKVIFNFYDRQLATDLISEIFYEFGLQGVIVEGQNIEPVDGFWDNDLKMPKDDAVIGYFPQNDYTEKRLDRVAEQLRRLKSENSIITQMVFREINEEDWAESWKVHFWPEKVSTSIVVKPTWREYPPAEGEIVVEIDPGMAFGTGTHPTTALCINMIEKYIQSDDCVLDVGTGSGILMITAAKLGAKKVVGVDTDEVAVEIARKNLLLNHIEPHRFTVLRGNLIDEINERFNLVVANILSEVILVLLDSVNRILAHDGILICSGIIEDNAQKVLEKMALMNFEVLEVVHRETWSAIAGKRKRLGL